MESTTSPTVYSKSWNPQLLYDSIFKFTSESNERPSAWLAKMVIDYDDDLSMTAENLKKKWWDTYGKHCPELQRMAMRLLSLTCSSCGSGQTWNAFEQVYPKKRSLLGREKLNDLFTVIPNFKSNIQRARTKICESINPEVVLSSDKELITEKEGGEASGAKKDMQVVHAQGGGRSEMVPQATTASEKPHCATPIYNASAGAHSFVERR